MTSLFAACDHLSTVVNSPGIGDREIQQATYSLIQEAQTAKLQDIEVVLLRMAAFLPYVKLRDAAFIALGCGTLIEFGANPSLASEAILHRAQEVWARVGKNVPVIEDDNVYSSEGEEGTVQSENEKEGRRVEEIFEAASLAVLMRIPETRFRVRKNDIFVAAMNNRPHSCLYHLFYLLEDEPIIVLYPELKRG